MKRFPPLISPLLSLAYLFILMGLSHWPWGEILLGTAAALVVLGVAACLSTRGHDEESRARPGHHAVGLVSIPALGALHRRARLRDTAMAVVERSAR